jgi:S-adenosylmethionine-diacylglycerol 3-amino-3-carboxypropyl transferase
MSLSRVSFAVVREDPELERAILERDLGGASGRAALVVASGGCTALSLLGACDALSVTAFDINPAQLEHVRQKFDAARGDASPGLLNIEDDAPGALNQRGEFERLFRVMRGAINSLVATDEELTAFFAASLESRRATVERWSSSPYWAPVFHSVFHGAMLEAMFGPSATQHATKGSYPAYFQRAFEQGLARHDAGENYFLHHVLLGRYLERALPSYLARPARALPRLVHGSLDSVTDLSRYDLVSLSNVLDWSDDPQTAAWASILRARCKRGCIVLVRQLNNQRDLAAALGEDFALDVARSRELLAEDRSLFYERVLVFRRARGGDA